MWLSSTNFKENAATALWLSQNHRAAWPPLYRRIYMNAHCGLWCILLDLNQRSADYKSAAQTIWAEDASCHTLVVTNGIFLVILEAFKKSAKPNWLLAAQTGIEPVRHGVKVRCLTSWLLRYIPTGSFKWCPAPYRERRATTWTLAVSCNGWSEWWDLNSQSPEPKSGALPSWATSRYKVKRKKSSGELFLRAVIFMTELNSFFLLPYLFYLHLCFKGKLPWYEQNQEISFSFSLHYKFVRTASSSNGT